MCDSKIIYVIHQFKVHRLHLGRKVTFEMFTLHKEFILLDCIPEANDSYNTNKTEL